MEKSKLKIFKPFLILIGFLILDKVLLIKPIKSLITENIGSNPYTETLENTDSSYLNESEKNKKKFWNFGTSRSMGFYLFPVDSHTKVDLYTDDKTKKIILQWQNFNFASPGSNPSIFYTRLVQLIERGHKPDAVFIELSPFSFNLNNRYNSISRLEGIPVNFALNHYKNFPKSYLSEITLSRIFLSYRYKVSMKTLKKKLKLENENYNDKMMRELQEKAGGMDIFALESEKLKKKEEKRYTNFGDYESDNIDSTSKFLKFEYLSNVLDKEFYNNFQIDEDQISFLKQIIKTTSDKNIRVIFWRPKIHPILNSIKTKYKIEDIWENRIKKLAAENSIPYYNLNQPGVIKCNYFMDASHLSQRCFTEMTGFLIDKLENKN